MGIVFVGDHEDFAGGVDIEDLGVVAGVDVADNCLSLEVENLDAVVLAGGDEKLAAVRTEAHVTRASTGRDHVLDFKGLRVEHHHGVIAFVAHVDLAANSRKHQSKRKQQRCRSGQAPSRHHEVSFP